MALTIVRTAWCASAGLVAHACTQMSPSLCRGSSASPGNAGSGTSAAGRRSRTPNRSSPNTDGPNPTVTVCRAGPSRVSVATAPVRDRSSRIRPGRSTTTVSNPAIDRNGSGGVAMPS